MSFDADVIKPGRGRALRVDISLDGFATVAYRYSDVAGVLDGTNQYTSRVLELGTVTRGFGQNRIAAPSTTTLKLANADGGVDWICGREHIGDAAKARFRIYVVLYDADASPLVFTAKMLGEFVLKQWPSQDDAEVNLALADDFMGKLGAGLLLPTLADWAAVGDTSNNPLKKTSGPGIRWGIPASIGMNTPVQLAFGEDALLALPHIIPWGNNATGETYEGTIIVPLYSTLDTSAVSQALVSQVTVNMIHAPAVTVVGYQPDASIPAAHGAPIYGRLVDDSTNVTQELYNIQRTLQTALDPATPNPPNWKVEKSPSITKGGLTFQIVYLVVRTHLGLPAYVGADHADTSNADFRYTPILGLSGTGNYPTEAVDMSDVAYRACSCRVLQWYVRGAPFSQRTNPPPSAIPISHPIDVITDLVSVYSSATVETVSAARVKAASPFTACAGVVSAWTERANNPSIPPPPLSLRQVLTELAQSSDLDIFMDWDGLLAFSSDVWDFTTATQSAGLVEILETELQDGTFRWVPSESERHAAFNRVYFEGGKPDPTNHQDVPFQGPFTLDAADIPTSTRIVDLGLRQGWRPYRQQAEDPWQWRSVDGVTRDMVQFRTHRGGLRLELGMCFKLTWTRGVELGGPYTSTIFQCEQIAYSPADDTVEITAVWRDDTTTERQYLLDDETLLVRTKNAATDLSLTDGDSLVYDGGGAIDFVAMGVTEGDILILRDGTQLADVFTRNRALRITVVDSATEIEVDSTDLDFDFPAGGTIANAYWSIVRGATTYPDAVSDPTNYPSGGAMYGKATAAAGTTSDSAAGNRLITG